MPELLVEAVCEWYAASAEYCEYRALASVVVKSQLKI